MSRSVFVPLHFYSCRKQSCLCLSDLFQHFSSLVLTAYSLASAPTKLKTCSCTSWHAFSHASPPPLISPPPLPSISLSLSFLSRLKAYSHQTWLGSRKRQRLNFKGRLQVCYTHTHTLPSHFKQPSPCSEDWLLQCSQLLSQSPKPDIIYARKTAI